MPGLDSLMLQLSCLMLSTAFQPQHQLCTPGNGLGHFAQSAEPKALLIALARTPLMNLAIFLLTLELLSNDLTVWSVT